ncbi:MAG: hypothetical protein H7Z74_14310 [Anaerolineae bacterium]|nr:hypothetical protein [Gemmatimonadaceae bacterium]
MNNANTLLLPFVIVAFACSSPPAGEQPQVEGPPPGGTIDKAMVARLEEDARALAKTEGCAGTGECKAAPMGAKACGGPRAWIVYCPLTTDEVALTRKLDELREAEERYNRESGLVSDCALLTEPRVELNNGVCRAAP